jgi:hypothetical protein
MGWISKCHSKGHCAVNKRKNEVLYRDHVLTTIPSSFAAMQQRGQVLVSTTRMPLFVVVPQQILSPIVPQISPYRMDMIRVVLGVVILDKKTGSMDSVIVGSFPLPRPCPRKMDIFSPFLLHPVHPVHHADRQVFNCRLHGSGQSGDVFILEFHPQFRPRSCQKRSSSAPVSRRRYHPTKVTKCVPLPEQFIREGSP